MQKTASLTDATQRRANVFRYGLMLIPPVAFAVSVSVPFMLARGAGLDIGSIISLAIIPALLWAVGAGILCFLVWIAYKRVVLKT